MANNLQAFGHSAVLTVEPVLTQSKTNSVNLELAPVVSGKANHKEKIVLQPTEKELPILVCILLGLIPAFTIKRDNKWISFIRQKENGCLYVKGGLRSVMSLPVTAGDCYLVGDLVMSQLCKNSTISATLIEANLKSVSKLYMKTAMEVLEKNSNG